MPETKNLSYVILELEGDKAKIHDIHVAGSERRKGIGTALMRGVSDMLKRQGVKEVSASVINIHAFRIFENLYGKDNLGGDYETIRKKVYEEAGSKLLIKF